MFSMIGIVLLSFIFRHLWFSRWWRKAIVLQSHWFCGRCLSVTSRPLFLASTIPPFNYFCDWNPLGILLCSDCSPHLLFLSSWVSLSLTLLSEGVLNLISLLTLPSSPTIVLVICTVPSSPVLKVVDDLHILEGNCSWTTHQIKLWYLDV